MGGIPHDIYGMTTRSVHRYVLGCLRKLGLKEENVSKIQTGGPDGDLGSNEVCHSLSLFLSFFLSFSLSLFLSFSFSLLLSFSLSPFLCLSLCLSLSLFLVVLFSVLLSTYDKYI